MGSKTDERRHCQKNIILNFDSIGIMLRSWDLLGAYSSFFIVHTLRYNGLFLLLVFFWWFNYTLPEVFGSHEFWFGSPQFSLGHCDNNACSCVQVELYLFLPQQTEFAFCHFLIGWAWICLAWSIGECNN